MEYIIDTHVLIWYLEGNEKLTNNIIQIIEDKKNIIFISIASLWEISIKINLNKLKLLIDLNSFKDILITNQINILSITFEDILVNSKLETFHKDPFDRIIISQSINRNCNIISLDQNFEYYNLNLINK